MSIMTDAVELEKRAKAVRNILYDLSDGDAGSVAMAVSAERAIAEGVDAETFGRMARRLVSALLAWKGREES
jgi:hypothetical protein